MGLGSIFRTTWFNLQVVSPVAKPFGPSLHLVIFIKLNHTKFQIFNNLGPTKMTISFVQPNIITFQLLNGDSFVYLFSLIQTSRGQGLCPMSKLKSGHISSDNVKYEKMHKSSFHVSCWYHFWHPSWRQCNGNHRCLIAGDALKMSSSLPQNVQLKLGATQAALVSWVCCTSPESPPPSYAHLYPSWPHCAVSAAFAYSLPN